MSALKHAFAICASAAILGLHLWVILPPGREAIWKQRYWPFTPYPMYSGSNYPGNVTAAYRLLATPCGGGPAREISYRDVAVGFGFFRRHLRRAAAPGSADPRLESADPALTEESSELLSGLVRSFAAEPICKLQVLEQAIVLGDVDDPYNVPWNVVRSWDVVHSDEDVEL